MIQIYYDDFNLTSNKVTEMAVVYFTIGNLPPHFQSSKDQIYLLLITKTEYLQHITFEGLFEKFFEDFRVLQDDPPQLSDDYLLRLELEMCLGDNEATNKLMAIGTNWRSDFCKLCNISYAALQKFYEPNNLDDNLAQINILRKLPRDHFFAPVINRKFFYALDMDHDFSFSGVMGEVLGCLIKIHYQDINQRNTRNLQKFEKLRDDLLEKLKKVNHRNGCIKNITNECGFDGYLDGI